MLRRSALVLGTLWVAGSVAATSVGLVAVRLVGNAVGDQVAAPLTGDAVRKALTSVPPTPPGEHEAEPSESPSVLGAVRTVSTRGGVLSARCRDHQPDLLYATPADGYRTVRSGATVVRFVGSSRQVTVTLACEDAQLTAAVTDLRLGSPPTSPTPSPSPHESSPSPEPHSSESSGDSSGPEPSGDSTG